MSSREETLALYEELLAEAASSLEKTSGAMAMDTARQSRGFFSKLLNRSLRPSSLKTAPASQMKDIRSARAVETGTTPEARSALAKKKVEARQAERGMMSSEDVAASNLSDVNKQRIYSAEEDSRLGGILTRGDRRIAEPVKPGVDPVTAQQPSSLGIGPYKALLGGAALAGGGYAGGQYLANRDANSRRNIAFGSGMATGLAAPGALRSLNTYVNKLQQPAGYGY